WTYTATLSKVWTKQQLACSMKCRWEKENKKSPSSPGGNELGQKERSNEGLWSRSVLSRKSLLHNEKNNTIKLKAPLSGSKLGANGEQKPPFAPNNGLPPQKSYRNKPRHINE